MMSHNARLRIYDERQANVTPKDGTASSYFHFIIENLVTHLSTRHDAISPRVFVLHRSTVRMCSENLLLCHQIFPMCHQIVRCITGFCQCITRFSKCFTRFWKCFIRFCQCISRLCDVSPDFANVSPDFENVSPGFGNVTQDSTMFHEILPMRHKILQCFIKFRDVSQRSPMFHKIRRCIRKLCDVWGGNACVWQHYDNATMKGQFIYSQQGNILLTQLKFY